ncbi:MAG TPA: DUF2520 domain-containing protein [Acidimicrobiales bacterium]|nr:DUF2520 domain-containing protein [Acidimicrobiales bacterium]
MSTHAVRVIGRGRAGRSLATALGRAGWGLGGVLGREDDGREAASGVDLLVLAVPDDAVAAVAAAIEPVPSTVVAHLAGSLGLEVLAPHERRAALHPLASLPSPEVGAERLRGAWFAIAGDPLIEEVVEALEGRAFSVADEHRAAYHAAAAIASNHLVALLAQVDRVAKTAGVPFDAYLDLVRATVENVAALGPVDALTGPAARGDEATISRHLEALPERERALYDVLAEACRQLAACES